MHPRIAWVPLAAVPLVALPVVSRAAETTEIASAFEEGDPFDLFIGVDYTFEAIRTAIKREYEASSLATPDGAIPIVKDLVFEQSRHIVTPHVQVGLYKGLELSVALPITIADNRDLVFDQRASPCIFSGDDATCINRFNSTTVAFDHLLPDGSGPEGLGYDAKDPTAGFSPDSKMVFRGVTRKGLDQIYIGLAFAPMQQEKDDTKPTWVVGGQLRLSIGQIMRFDRLDPESQNGVSRGVHEVMAYSSLSKRTHWLEPFVSFWWLAPFKVRGKEPGDPQGSLFWDLGFGQESWRPQQRAGTLFGVEAIPWENKLQKQKLSVELRGRVEAHFEGRGYSEMWEVFAYAGDVVNNPGAPLHVRLDPTQPSQAPISYPGVGMIENYLTVGGRLGVRGQIGERAKFSASFEYAHDQKHHISWNDAGEDRNGNRVVDPDSAEVNPLHQPIIDIVGRRYLADENNTFVFFVNGTLMF